MNMKPRTLMLYGFLFVAASAATMLLYIIWTIGQRPDDVLQDLSIISEMAWLSIGLLLVILAGTFFIIERFFVQPYYTLSRDVENFVLSGTGDEFTFNTRHALGKLPLRIQSLAQAQIDARKAREVAVEEATRSLAEQKSHLEAVLSDLHEGVVICNLNHQIILYNKRALELLHVTGDLGLGRSLFSVMNRQPFLHALERLTNRLGEGRHETHKYGLSTQFIAATTDGQSTFEGRISLIIDDDESPQAYIATFEDRTKEIVALATRDRLLRSATEGLRQPIANIRVATEALSMNADMPDVSRHAFVEMISAEVTGLSETLDDLAGDYREVITGSWPMADIYSANLLNCVVRRLREEKDITGTMTGIPNWLHGDSYTLVEILDYLVHKIHSETGAAEFDIETNASEKHVNLDIIWSGAAIAASDLDRWLKSPLTNTVGGMTGREILDHHKTDIWSQSHGDGRARLRIPLRHADELPEGDAKKDLPARPEFYDFALSQLPTDIADMPLKELSFVVFDTETTGLKPSEGDKIISIAGVRVVNGRILTGEVYSELVHPGRAIPKESIQFHGITDDMVQDKPMIETVLPRFHDYVGDHAILVAHNAAFDMKFIKMYQGDSGVKFQNPALCTMLLSKFLHNHTEAHSIDDLCDRFGLTVDGRHTALGDAMVTAAILVKLIDLLEEEGISTLNQAVTASNKVAELKVLEAQF